MDINYNFKNWIIEQGYLSLYIQFRKEVYNQLGSLKPLEIEKLISGVRDKKTTFKRVAGDSVSAIFYKILVNYKVFWFDETIYKECVLIYNADRQRIRRLTRRIESLCEKPCLFLTLSFSPQYLDSTTKEERRVDICRYLKSICNNYVANIDYGKKNGREHYHAVVQLEHLDMSTYEFGGIYVERVYTGSDNSSLRLSHYISKIINHAVKKTTKREALIYSR